MRHNRNQEYLEPVMPDSRCPELRRKLTAVNVIANRTRNRANPADNAKWRMPAGTDKW